MKADSLHPLVQKASALDARPPSQVIVPKLNADIWPKADILPFRKAGNSDTGLHRADWCGASHALLPKRGET
jgi:hypothetical protein